MDLYWLIYALIFFMKCLSNLDFDRESRKYHDSGLDETESIYRNMHIAGGMV